MTNGDRIRAMSDEELARLIEKCPKCEHCQEYEVSCNTCIARWLKEEEKDV